MSAIFMTNTTAESVLAGGTIPLTTIQRRKGCILTNSSNAIQILRPGYYLVEGTITFTAPAAGNVIISLQKGGVNVSGINGSSTITTATTEIRTIPISGIIRVLCNETAIINLVNTGVAITTSNVSLSVVSID